MATTPTLVLFSLLATAVLLLSPGGDAAAVECSTVMMAMMDCLEYVQVGSKVGQPGDACCGGVTAAVKLDPTCLCEALKEASKMGMQLNMTRATALPGLCSIKSGPSASDCGLAPQPSPIPVPPKASPAPSAPPKASPAPSTPALSAPPKASPAPVTLPSQPPSLPPVTPPPAPLTPTAAPTPPNASTTPSAKPPAAYVPATSPSGVTSGAAILSSSAFSVLLGVGVAAVFSSLF